MPYIPNVRNDADISMIDPEFILGSDDNELDKESYISRTESDIEIFLKDEFTIPNFNFINTKEIDAIA